MAAKVQAVRSALYDSVNPDDVHRAVRRIVSLTQDADPKVATDAIKLMFDRLIGKPAESLSLDVATNPATSPAPILNLSAEEIGILERLVVRSEPAL